MTICISVICDNSSKLIVASDSMLTNEMLSIQFEHLTKKMTELSNKCIALTAGDALAHTELFNAVQCEIDRLKEPSILKIVATVKECYQGIRKRVICERILKPRGFNDFDEFYHAHRFVDSDIVKSIQFEVDRYDYGLQIIISGISGGKAHIFSISDPGTSNCFNSIGFHAIGSGLPHAINTLIARGCHQEMSLEETLLIVYEAKKLAERAPGVGIKTNIAIIHKKGITLLPQERLNILKEIYDKWVRKEQSWLEETQSFLNELGIPKIGVKK